MHWKPMRECGEMYCAVHNADCPYHGQRDQMVLSVSPGMIPEAWVCPDAVMELAQFEREAEKYAGGGEFTGMF